VFEPATTIPEVYQRALWLCGGDPERAEELEQRTRVRAWELSTTTSEEVRSPVAYRLGVLRKVHMELLREERRHRHIPIADPGRMPGAAPSPTTEVEEAERRQCLHEAVDSLRRTLHVVVKLRFFEGVPQRTIADRLQCSEATVSRLLSHAREVLKQMLP
jgi:RNA polymerase sigma factor (sigma-70 family)